LIESVGAGSEIVRVTEQAAVFGGHGLPGLDNDRAPLAGGLEAALGNEDLRLAVQGDVEPVEALVQDVRGDVGRMDLDGFLAGERADPQVGAAFKDVDLDPVISLRGKDGEFHLAVIVEAQVVPAAEMDFDLAGPCCQLVPLDQSHVHLALLGPEVRCPLDEDFAVDEGQPGEARGVIAVGGGVRLGDQTERNANEESDR
jgi:hypothetical protein